MAETPMIEVQNITKRIKGLTAVKDVSFSIRPGGITGMIGPNGAGLSSHGRQDLLQGPGHHRQKGV